MKDTERIIDTAIDTYPLEDLPSGFVSRTMAHIAPPPRFKLTFTDLALPAFFAIFGAIILASFYWLFQSINAPWGLNMGAWISQLAAFSSSTTVFLLGIATALCLVLMACAILVLSFWLDKPVRLQGRAS
jgi:hypothetical protein